MPTDGCPDGSVPWRTGLIYQDTEDDDNVNDWSYKNNLGIQQANGDTKQHFCMKLSNIPSHDYPWPKGSYCILKKGACPKG